MKVLICSINSKYIHSSLAPWCIAAGLEKYAPEIEYKVLEMTINENQQVLFDKISNESFDLIGFSTYIWNLKTVSELCKYAKEIKGAITVLGGPEVSYNAAEHLKNDFVDFVISGEGERPFAELCMGMSPEKIKGVSYKKSGEIFIGEENIECQDPPSPYTQKYLESLNGRIAYIETSRGCPFNCSFCLSGRCSGVRFFDLERSKNDIITLANSGTQTVKFVDRTFNASKKRSKELFKFIIENYGKLIPENVCFHFEIEATLLDLETLEILSVAPIGAIQLEIGIQSFNLETLKSINRKRDLFLLVKNIKKLIELQNMHIHIDLIAGLPCENFESFKNSFNRAYELKSNMLQIGFLKLLHGSEMMGTYECEYSNTPPYEIISSPYITNEELSNLHCFEDVFERMYNSSRFPRTCEYLTSFSENPFDVFFDFAMHLKNNVMISPKTLDDFTLCLFEYFSKKEVVDANRLRDLLVMDRLSTNKMGTVPEFLKIHSPMLKKALNYLEKDIRTRKPQGIKRAISLLSSLDKCVYVDYENVNPITKQYKLYECDIRNI